MRTQPTESQIKLLMSDWLGGKRLGENHTHEGERGITSDKTIREYLIGNLSGLDSLELIRRSRKAARNVIDAVAEERIEVTVGGNGAYQSPGTGKRKRINLATDYFDDKEIDNGTKADIMLGLAAHEAAHAVYTPQDTLERNLKGAPPETARLKKHIFNLIEDERIEWLLGEERPGLATVIGKTKEYYFKRLKRRIESEGKAPDEPVAKLLNVMTTAVRYPSEMSREEITDNYDDLTEIRKALIPYPMTEGEVWSATDKILEIVRRRAEEDSPEDRQNGSQDQDDNQDGEGQPEDNNANQGEGTGGSDKNGGRQEGKGKRTLEEALSSGQARKTLEALTEDDDKSSGDRESSALRGDPMATLYANDDKTEMAGGAGTGLPKTFILKPDGSEDAYRESLERIAPYVAGMSKALSARTRQREYILRGMPAGKINRSRLAGIAAGNTNIFTRQGTVKSTSASVVMLIDESGSMTRRLLPARDAAVLVNEAIRRIRNTRFFCYGYTSGLINVYAENGKTSRWALGDTSARGGTPTGEAMTICAERVRRMTSSPCLMLVLTDGNPDDPAKVISADKRLGSMGFTTIGVGIQTNIVDGQYKRSVMIDNMREFSTKVGLMVKDYLNRTLKQIED